MRQNIKNVYVTGHVTLPEFLNATAITCKHLHNLNAWTNKYSSVCIIICIINYIVIQDLYDLTGVVTTHFLSF